MNIIFSGNGHIYLKERKGRLFGIRYAKDMTVEDIKRSIKNNPPKAREFQPYNTSTNSFI